MPRCQQGRRLSQWLLIQGCGGRVSEEIEGQDSRGEPVAGGADAAGSINLKARE